MGFVPVPDTARVEMLYTQGTSYVENVMWFERTGGWHVDELDDLCQTLVTWYQASLRPLQSQYVTLTKIIARDWSIQNGEVFEQPVTATNTGQHLGQILPGHVTLAVKFNTGFAGRSYRGRNYVLGLCEDQVTGDGVNADVAAGYGAAYEALATSLTSKLYHHVVASQYHDNLPRVVGVHTAIQSYTVDTTIDSQRRRLSGRGR